MFLHRVWNSVNNNQSEFSSLSASTNENREQFAVSTSPWDTSGSFSSVFTEPGQRSSSTSFFSFSEDSRVPAQNAASGVLQQTSQPVNTNEQPIFQAYSPLLGPAPFHSTFEKLLQTEKSNSQPSDISDEHLDIVSPLFDCEDTTGQELDGFRLDSNKDKKNPEEQQNEQPKEPEKDTKPRKRTKSKKSKVVLSLQDFQCMEGEEIPPVEELEPGASPVLWVGNIGPLISEQQVFEEFSIYGNVINLHILRDK